ncbi:spermatogenesis-associated protein 6 isoform X2 [Ambystoma mexicanum]|uniref:spermatogenesis-associated protein 6 isoform X2 n=1 Tax=Ambystoma mexicanum TaxID=8296 RepID=UPI0037E9397F
MKMAAPIGESPGVEGAPGPEHKALVLQDSLGKMHHSTPVIRYQQTDTFRKEAGCSDKKHPPVKTRSYEQPTVASKSRSPSPYTKRRMCELSDDARQRLSHLNLGPYEFKKETDTKPPFVIEKSPSTDTSLLTCSPPEGMSASWPTYSEDLTLLGSYRPKNAEISTKPTRVDHDRSFDRLDERLIAGPAGRQSHSARSLMTHSAPSSAQKDPQTPVLNRSSLRERFHPDLSMSANWEEIHERVKKILRTHGPRQRLSFDKSVLQKEDLSRNTESSRWESCCDSKLHDRSLFNRNFSVHLDNGEYWSNRAAQYKGKNHRAIFEDSLEKIYRNMYRNASDANVRRRSLNLQ